MNNIFCSRFWRIPAASRALANLLITYILIIIVVTSYIVVEKLHDVSSSVNQLGR